LPFGPAAIQDGLLLLVGTGNSVNVPLGVIRPIWLAPNSVNHRLPSGPAAMPPGSAPAVGIANSVAVPISANRTTRSFWKSVYQRLPSALVASALFCVPAVGAGNSVTVPIGGAASAAPGRITVAASVAGRARRSRAASMFSGRSAAAPRD
jgi:hypothetical protein